MRTGEHPLATIASCGRISSRRSTSSRRERPHPAGRSPARRDRRRLRRYEAAIIARRRHRLPDSRHRQDGTHRLQRAGLRRGQPHAPRHARRRHAPGRRGRFLRRRVRAARSGDDGRRDDPRAREIAIIATGEHKATIVQRAVEGEIDVRSPRRSCSAIRNTTFYSIAPPPPSSRASRRRGCSTKSSGRESSIVRAVIWLSQQTGRAILKLTQRDYADARLSSLVAQLGSPGEVNGKVFNTLGAKIRGSSKLPTSRRSSASRRIRTTTSSRWAASCASSSRTTTTIIVAYMTSGNIAVFDHDVRRYVDFLERLARRRSSRSRAKVDALARTRARRSSTRRSPAKSTSPRCRTSSASFAKRKR